jgi:hypothetical protein
MLTVICRVSIELKASKEVEGVKGLYYESILRDIIFKENFQGHISSII